MKREDIFSNENLKDFKRGILILLAIIGILLLIDKIFPWTLDYIQYYLRGASGSDVLSY